MSLKFDILQFPGTDQTNFSTRLFQLMLQADQQNYHRLKRAFPNAAAVLEAWRADETGDSIPDLPYDSEDMMRESLLAVLKFAYSVMVANHDDIELSEQMALEKMEAAIILAEEDLSSQFGPREEV